MATITEVYNLTDLEKLAREVAMGKCKITINFETGDTCGRTLRLEGRAVAYPTPYLIVHTVCTRGHRTEHHRPLR